MAEGCKVRATLGYPGRKVERCRAHMLDGMVRIILPHKHHILRF